jgi:hypothetical protein
MLILVVGAAALVDVIGSDNENSSLRAPKAPDAVGPLHVALTLRCSAEATPMQLVNV